MVLSALVVACHAGVIDVDQGHGHAVSSQSIIRHDQQAHQTLHQQAPIYQQSTKILQHSAPIYQQAAIQHFTPLVQHSSPIVHHVAPVVEHSEPIYHHVAPVVHHAAPITHYSKVVSPIAVGHQEQIEEQVSALYFVFHSAELNNQISLQILYATFTHA